MGLVALTLSLWGSFSKGGLFLKAKIDGADACENSLESKIVASSNENPTDLKSVLLKPIGNCPIAAITRDFAGHRAHVEVIRVTDGNASSPAPWCELGGDYDRQFRIDENIVPAQ